MDQQNERVTRRPSACDALSADSVYEDAAGDLWLLASSPVAGLVRYDRLNGILAGDGDDGLWVPSSEGLSYFDLRARRFTHRFRHDEVNPSSLDSNAVFAVYQDRGGVLWVGLFPRALDRLDRTRSLRRGTNSRHFRRQTKGCYFSLPSTIVTARRFAVGSI